MNTCDLLIEARWLLPIAPENVVLERHALAISDGCIIATGPSHEITRQYHADDHLNFDQHIVLPGLVNAHGHAAMTLLRGAGEDQSLQAWLRDTIWPLEARHVDADFVRLGTQVAIAEMLSTGTTTFADMYFFPEECANIADTTGMRAQVCFPVIEFQNVWSDGVKDGLHKGLSLHDAYRHHDRIDIAIGPHSAYTVSAESLEKVLMYANELDMQVQIHMHENPQEVADALTHHGETWIRVLNRIGLLGPNLQTVHMTQVSDEDLATIADSSSRVVHCPSSNLKLASGLANVQRFRDAGIRVALGTDGAASNNTLNLFNEAHIATLIAKHGASDPTHGNARDTLRMATLDGAAVLGLEEKIGSLEVGKAADFIAVDADNLTMMPHYDPFSALVHGEAGRYVSHACVAGETIYSDGKFAHLDTSELRHKVRQWHDSEVRI